MRKAVKSEDLPNQFIQILSKDMVGEVTNEFIKYIVYAIASTDETIDHLETLFKTDSLKDKELYDGLLKKSNLLGKKLIKFLESVEKQNLSEK